MPPPELITLVFPWIEEEQLAYKAQQQQYGQKAEDLALEQFLSLLIHLRTILLQDGAVLFSENPYWALFQYAPFNSPEFRVFAESSTEVIVQTQAEHQVQLEKLPERIAESFQGSAQNIRLEQQIYQDENRALFDWLTTQVSVLGSAVTALAVSKLQRKDFGMLCCSGFYVYLTHVLLVPLLPLISRATRLTPASSTVSPITVSSLLPHPILNTANLTSNINSPGVAFSTNLAPALDTMNLTTDINPPGIVFSTNLTLARKQQAALDDLKTHYGTCYQTCLDLEPISKA